MSRCRKLSTLALTGCFLISAVARLQAQSDADVALKNAREALQAEQFERARDLASTASQTDRKNPDVWLLLGKAQFQLGELDQALASWRMLLQLAPNQAYARRMVTALEGRMTDIDVLIRLAATQVSQGLTKSARPELVSLRSRPSLSAEQREAVQLLLVEVELLEGKGSSALALLNELSIRNPEAVATLSARVLKARSELAVGGALAKSGLSELGKIAKEAKEAPEGKVAALELLLYETEHGTDVVASVAAWIEQNGTSSAARRARLAVRDSVTRFLAASRPPIGSGQDAELTDNDKSALAAAAFAVKVFVDPADQLALAKALTEHFEKKYLVIRGYVAAHHGLDLIRKLELPEAANIVIAASQKRVDEAEAQFEYEKIHRDMNEAIVGPDVMSQWIAENAGHPKELEARRALVFAWLNVTRRQAAPASDAGLSEADLKALEAAAELVGKLKGSAEITALIQGLGNHFKNHYFERGARAAAIDGLKRLVAFETPVKHANLMITVLDLQRQLAIADLQAAVAAGMIAAETSPMPASLQAVSDTADLINKDYPASPAWFIQAELANHILDHTKSVPWPTKIRTFKAVHVWALRLASRVIVADADAKSVARAHEAVDRVLAELSAITQPDAKRLAAFAQEMLLLEIAPGADIRPTELLKHVDLLIADAARAFDANVKSGEAAKNAKLSEIQSTILKELAEAVQLRPALASVSLQKLTAYLQKWSTGGHDAVVESAFQTFATGLPPATQRQARLALARLWFGQVQRSHHRTVANGFQVARVLDARSKLALEECYRLAGSLGAGDPVLANVRTLRIEVIDHYLALKFEDVAEAAIKVKADPASADLDEESELEVAALLRRNAESQLARQLTTHDGRKQIVLTPAFNEAIAALQKFITDHPSSERVSTAADGIFVIGKRFEQHEASLIAARIYADFEVFAAKFDSLKQEQPGKSTFPERAALARASALHMRASNALQKWNAAKPDDAQPPAALSDEFVAAQTAWQKVITDYQQRPAAQTAIGRILAIAQEYAALNAWDVADSTYASLLTLELPLRSPERLEFGRAICQLGKVLPEHARTVLTALAITGNSPVSGGKNRELTVSGLMGSVAAIDRLSDSSDFKTSTINGPQPATATPQSRVKVPALANGSNSDLEATAEVLAADAAPQGFAKRELRDVGRVGGVGGGFGPEGGEAEFGDRFRQESDARLLAAVRTQLDRQAQQVAMLRDKTVWFRSKTAAAASSSRQTVQKPGQQQGGAPVAVLTDAELARQQKVLDAVYASLQTLRKKYAESKTAEQARDAIFVVVNHWREIAQWDRAAKLARTFLTDNPTDINLPIIRQDIARDWLAWAAVGVRNPELDREELLGEIASRFKTARDELQAIIVAFPDETAVRHQAQWDIATSFLTQARVVAASSPTLARGQFVRATTELLRVSEFFHDHPQIGTIPDILWGVSDELAARNYHDEAISVWNEIQIHYPTHKLADQSALRIAQTWQRVGQPLRAAEAFLELNFARGGSDADLQNTIYQIAVTLKNEKRWIESLHVLQTFVDSFPAHANGGQSLTMIGQIHQTNEVWDDAMDAYRRVIDEFPTGTWTTEARWSIAECTINLSLWQEAMGAYASFQESYPKDARVAEAARRIEVLKVLDRYQGVIDEAGQRKAFDAQFQVAAIVRTELTNPVKAIIEYRKVAKNWPQSHLADDALFEIGKIYLELGETELARTALLESAESYPNSPLADDALLLVGTSYVSEADRLAAVDRGKSQEIAKHIAQKEAYRFAQDNTRRQHMRNSDLVTALKKQGKRDEAANKEAYFAGQAGQFAAANTLNASQRAMQQEEVLSAAQLADRQDKINAALRKAVASFRQAASVPAADTADDALLQMAQIYDQRLKDSEAAMSTWEEIVKQYSGTAVAEDASWNMASYLQGQEEHAKAIAAYQTFFRNYRRSDRAGQAQAAIAENYEHLGEWVQAMDAYTNYVNNFPKGPLLKKAQDQISWIKTYRL
jgi:tetratricopeptide (TPR) repeat protein